MNPESSAQNQSAPKSSPFNWSNRAITTILSSSILLGSDRPPSEPVLNSSVENHYLANDVLTTFPDQPLLNGLDRLLYSLGITDLGFGGGCTEVQDLFVRSKVRGGDASNVSSVESTHIHSIGDMLDNKWCGLRSHKESGSSNDRVNTEHREAHSNESVKSLAQIQENFIAPPSESKVSPIKSAKGKRNNEDSSNDFGQCFKLVKTDKLLGTSKTGLKPLGSFYPSGSDDMVVGSGQSLRPPGSLYPSTSKSFAKNRDSSINSSNSHNIQSKPNEENKQSENSNNIHLHLENDLIDLLRQQLKLIIRSRSDLEYQKSLANSLSKPGSILVSSSEFDKIASEIIVILQHSSKVSFDAHSKVAQSKENSSTPSMPPVSRNKSGQLVVNSTFLKQTIHELLDNLIYDKGKSKTGLKPLGSFYPSESEDMIEGSGQSLQPSDSLHPSISKSFAKIRDSSSKSSNSQNILSKPNEQNKESENSNNRNIHLENDLIDLLRQQLKLIIRSRSDLEYRKSLANSLSRPGSILVSRSEFDKIASEIIVNLKNASKVSFDAHSKVAQSKDLSPTPSMPAVSRNKSGQLVVNSTFLKQTIHELLDNLIYDKGTKSLTKANSHTLGEVVESEVVIKITDMQIKPDLDVPAISENVIDLLNVMCKCKVSASSRVVVSKDNSTKGWRPAITTNRSGELTVDPRMLSDTIDRVLTASTTHMAKPSFVVIKEANSASNDESYDRRKSSISAEKQIRPSSEKPSKKVSIDSARKVNFDEIQSKHPNGPKSVEMHSSAEKQSDDLSKGEPRKSIFQVVSCPINVREPIFSARQMAPSKRTTLPKTVKTQYAITRINTFDDTSVTYEVMRPMDQNPFQFLGGDGQTALADHRDVLFAVMPDRTTVCYSAV